MNDQNTGIYINSGSHLCAVPCNYLIEGLDQIGTLIDSGNVSNTPRWSDWGAARTGCNGVYWGPTDKIAHHPSLPGWMDLLIHCER
ncbi:MAG: hypothetical protein IMZ50_01525 [Candidatus Atribacteria bacterium]|nr:hypothetical protein [Candidatus Atribacteria bacterium]